MPQALFNAISPFNKKLDRMWMCKYENHNKFTQIQSNIPFRELTYPTLGKGKPSSKVPLGGDMLVPRRVHSLSSIIQSFGRQTMLRLLPNWWRFACPLVPCKTPDERDLPLWFKKLLWTGYATATFSHVACFADVCSTSKKCCIQHGCMAVLGMAVCATKHFLCFPGLCRSMVSSTLALPEKRGKILNCNGMNWHESSRHPVIPPSALYPIRELHQNRYLAKLKS